MLRNLADQTAALSLVQALRLPAAPRLALVGSGGKTTALFQLARELLRIPSPRDLILRPPAQTVLLAATTHMAVTQATSADVHFTVDLAHPRLSRPDVLPQGAVLWTGPEGGDERLAGIDLPALHWLVDRSIAGGLPLIIEADGSRQRPLKAPANHEPALPHGLEWSADWLGLVVVIAGLSGLGQPLDELWVHRPERFAELSGLQPGALVTGEALQSVLLHPQGGLKNIPAAARRVALLNQADSPILQSWAADLSKALLSVYQAVVVTSLAPPAGYQQPAVHAVHEQAGAVILAAGASLRFGQPKQLLPWRGKPFVRQVAETALAAGLDPVVVVIGSQASLVRQALVDLPVLLVDNPDWQAGQSTSVRCGLLALPDKCMSCLFMLADQPHIPASLLSALREAHAANLAPITAPQAGGQRANPVLFDRVTFPDLLGLQGDTGGRVLFAKYRPAWLPWHDTNILLDVDRPEDYQRLQELQ